MSARSARPDAGVAVAGLFARTTATGGLAGRDERESAEQRGRALSSTLAGEEPRVRLGVELREADVGFLRALSRPSRTGGPRTLGSKFVGTGVLVAAIELLRTIDVDMGGVAAGDLDEMTRRARAALLRAACDEWKETAR
jgi:hypothetical protein